MIKSIKLKNFQSHADTTFDLSNGLNVIMGSSNHGKSSIVRALKWVILNRPRGDAFKSNFAKKSEPVSVKITLDDGTVITREKKGSANQYILYRNGEEKIFKALGADVPDEIKEVLAMDSINIQSQGDPYFMLGDNPGVRAKFINKIVGLEIIDETIRKATALVNDTKGSMKAIKGEIESTETELSKYADVEQIGDKIAKVDFLSEKLIDLEDYQALLNNMVDDVKLKQSENDEIKEWLKIEQDFIPIEEKAQKLKDLEYLRFTIAEDIKGIKFHQKANEDLEAFLECESKVFLIEELVKVEKEKTKELNSLRGIVNGIIHSQKAITLANIDINNCIEELNEIGVCPTCGQEVEAWT